MSNKEIDLLFERTLAGEYDDEFPWEAVRTLQWLGTREVFDRAAQWCESEDPCKRARGANVLAQLGKTAEHPSNTFPDESFVVASRLLQKETEVRPLASAIYALGHLSNPAAVPLICPYRSHADAN